MNDSWGKVHFFLTFIFMNGIFYPMHILGMRGFPRRLADPYHYETFHHLLPMNQFMSWCAFADGRGADHLRGQFLLQHVLRSARRPESVERQRTGMDGPEPPGHGNFDFQPIVYRGPYEYYSPEVERITIRRPQPPQGGCGR